MKYLFKNLKPYWRSVLILAVFLVIQGFCEMSMPQYTQNIIDVGIQDKGIGHILPSRITEKEYGNAQLFMDDSQKREWQDAYTKSGKTYSLKELGNKQLDELDEDLLTPPCPLLPAGAYDSERSPQHDESRLRGGRRQGRGFPRTG